MSSSATSSAGIFRPTCIGLIETEEDAHQLLTACLSGVLRHAPRYPRGDELQKLIRNGHIFVYADSTTGTGNWDDGKVWEYLRDEDGFRIERQGSSRDGLHKRSISIVEKGDTHHIVSYYRLVEGGLPESLTRHFRGSKP